MWDRSLVHRNKGLARLGLYGVPFLLVAGAVAWIRWAGTVPVDMSWRDVDWASMEEVRLLQEYVRIDTSNPDGNEIPGAELLARELREVGLDVRLERLGPRNANLWAVLEGRDPRALVLHNHLDTDPIRSPEGWTRNPFSGDIYPPYLMGRGAFDMKSVAVAQLLSIRDLASKQEPPGRTVIFLATGDEEVGSWLGIRHVLALHPELLENAWGALSEGGAVEAVDPEMVKYWGTEFAQKRFVDLTICHPDRRILEELRTELQGRHGPARLSPEARTFFAAYGGTRPEPAYRRTLLRAAEGTLDATRLTRYTRSMVRSELTFREVESSPEGGFRMEGSLGLVPGAEVESELAVLIPEGLAGFAVALEVPHPPTGASPIDHPVFREIDRLLEERYPSTSHGPLFTPWSVTDSRFFRAAGIPSWGFSPFRLVASDSHKLGGVGERITLPEYVEGVALYRDLVARLAAPPRELAPDLRKQFVQQLPEPGKGEK